MTNAIEVHKGLMPALSIEEAVGRYNAVVEFTKAVMKPGKDYGIIPGTGTKPTLLKPGAEKLCSLFGMVPEFTVLDKIVDFDGGLFYFHYQCRLMRNGELVATGEGSANSREKKYRYRNVVEWKASDAEKAAALRVETRNGRRGEYKVYVIENKEPFDLINTLQKMGQKRALVAATLIAANASEFFTQDIEDLDIIDGEYTVSRPPGNGNGRKQPSPVVPRSAAPEMLKGKLAEWAANYEGQAASEKHRNMLASHLGTTFDGDDTKRYEWSKFYLGAASTKDMEDSIVLACLKTFLGCNSWGDIPSKQAVTEVRNSLAYALEQQGQPAMEFE